MKRGVKTTIGSKTNRMSASRSPILATLGMTRPENVFSKLLLRGSGDDAASG